MQFFAQNAHFAVSLLAGLASFAVFWLIFDAWLERRSRREILNWLGFLILALGFTVSATSFDSASGAPGLLATLISHLAVALRLVGYALIVAGQALTPLQLRPTEKSELTPPPKPKTKANKSIILTGLTGIKLILLPLLPVTVGALYLRRATVGLERHLRPVALAFGFIGLYELLGDATTWQNTANPALFRLVTAYGPVWWIAQAALLVGGIWLGRWVWQYLTRRLFTQLFMVLTTATVIIFFISTVGFSFLLMRNIQTEALSELSTASHVLGYAIASRQSEAAAQAQADGQNPAVVAAVAGRDHQGLASALAGNLAAHQLTSLIVTDGSGQVLLRAEDPTHWGDSVSGDSLVGRALIGTSAQSVTVTAGVIAPSVELVAASPIRDAGGNIIGVVEAGRTITDTFVDGIKASTGLDSTIYGGNIRAATTLTGSDGTTRQIGIKETSAGILKTVLTDGKSYDGPVSLQNQAYLAAYAPLKNVDNQTVAMLVITRSQADLFAVAGRTVELTFSLSIALLLVCILPVYLLARRMAEQMR